MRLRGQVYRAHHPGWAFQPESGEGAARHGGRFNPRGLPALYCSLRFETAWIEAQQGFPFKAQPMTLCAYDVDCQDIVDLTGPGELGRLGPGDADLACAWEDLARSGREPPSWAVARRLLKSGAAGILVRSFAPGAGQDDVNAVFWRWSGSPPHRDRVIDRESRLPRDRSSWSGP